MIIFSFSEGPYKATKKYKHLREILKEIPSLRKKMEIFDDIFGRLYSRVDYKYHCLVEFALIKASEVRIKITAKDLLEESE